MFQDFNASCAVIAQGGDAGAGQIRGGEIKAKGDLPRTNQIIGDVQNDPGRFPQ